MISSVEYVGIHAEFGLAEYQPNKWIGQPYFLKNLAEGSDWYKSDNCRCRSIYFSRTRSSLALAETPLFSENSNYGIYSNDPAEWALTADLIDHFVQNPPLHGLSNNQDLSTSVRYYESKKR